MTLPRRPITLTARLVAVSVLLVAVAAAAIATVTTVAMRQHLDQRLDADVRDAMRFALGPGVPRPHRGPEDFGPGQQFGTVRAVIPEDTEPAGLVLSEEPDATGSISTALDEDQLDALAALTASPDAHDVDLPGLGSYRVLVTDLDGGRVVAGLPRAEIDETIANLIRLELLATLIGVLAAGVVGTYVVRRQLAPLREVADTAHRVIALPLGSGDIALEERVPDRLTDGRTEVGQVGNALNALLDHVESSLAARHRSEQQVRQFVADASHELRTPLATIAGHSELARRHPEDEVALRTALAKVDEESLRMTSLVEDLLLLARLDAGRPLERKTVDLTSLLLEAVADARILGPEHRWRLDLPERALEVLGDEQRLHQVITNLLTNARKHTPPGTTVTASADSRGFSVHDDGPGFGPDLADHAFERFTRGDRSRRRDGGVGLGLALVHAIVAALGGEVALDSQPGNTTVRVQLPRG